MLSTLGDLMRFFWGRRKLWMIPMAVMMVLLAVLQVIGNSPVFAPFIYALF